MKNLILILLLLVSLSTSAQWSYSTLSQAKAEIDAAAIGNKIILHSGSIVKGTVIADSDTTEIWDLVTGTKQIIILPDRPVRRRAITTVVNKVFFAGGSTSITTSNQVDIYDTWTRTALSLDRNGIAAASANGRAYFAGGWNGASATYSRIVNIYDTQTSSWILSELEYLNPTLTTTQRQYITAATIGNKILFAGGQTSSSNFKNLVNTYDTENLQWLPNTWPLSQMKTQMSSIVYKNKAYFSGGLSYKTKSTPTDTIDIFDNETNSWTVMKIPRLMNDNNTSKPIRPYHQAVQAGCKMFLVPAPSSPTNGNDTKQEIPDTIAVYDFARNIWSYMPLPHPRTYVTAIAAGNKVVFAGGQTLRWGTYLKDVDILTLSPKLQTVAAGNVTNTYTFDKTNITQQKTINIQLSNEGDYDLFFSPGSKFEINGANESDFIIEPITIGDTLSPAQITSLPITFKPATIGDKSATLTIYSNDPEHAAYTFELKGKASDDPSTGVDDNTTTQTTKVYPNPADNLLHVQILKSFSFASLTLRDINGKIQRQANTPTKENYLNTSNLAEGLYLLEINIDGTSNTEKIIISH